MAMMHLPFPLLLALSWLAHSSIAHLVSSRFPGYGFQWYDPKCGYACYNSISGAMLSCSTGGAMSDMPMSMAMSTSPACYASDTFFLTTLAYCLNTTCVGSSEVPGWKIEQFWETEVTGDSSVIPKWTYARALTEITTITMIEYNSSMMLNETAVVHPETLKMQLEFNYIFDYMEMIQAKYAFVLITIGFGTPVLFALLVRLPFMTSLVDRIKPYLVYPSFIGTYSVRPLPWLMGNSPTVGQALYITMFFILNIIICSVNYHSQQPHPWGFNKKDEMLAYVGYRTGHLGYAMLPLVILFATRNNFLLWITNWSYNTYILLHRWISRLFAIYAIVHSITLLICYQGTGGYAADHILPYWQWGIVATVLTCAMLVFSHIHFRRLSYEIFLIGHIIMAVFVIVGCWYHIVPMWGNNFYLNWLYAACAIWFFDRLVRIIRLAKNGVRNAVVTEVGPDHVRVDIEGVRWVGKPGYVTYAYFPSLNPLRPWENHPFSVNSTSLFRNYQLKSAEASRPSLVHARSSENDVQTSENGSSHDASTEKAVPSHAILAANDDPSLGTTGVTLIIKKSTGLTRLLKSATQLTTLLEGPYPFTHSSEILKCDRILLLGGGIGITGLIPWLHAHSNVKLTWSVKERHNSLVAEMANVLHAVEDKEVVVGGRLDLDFVLKAEAEMGYGKVGVVVCGPAEMCDEVRAAVAGLGRGSKTVFELEVDAFSW